jgi:hypothetical protein
MITFQLFNVGVDGVKWHLTAVNNTPTLELCLSRVKGERVKVRHDIQMYEASIRDIPNHTLYL